MNGQRRVRLRWQGAVLVLLLTSAFWSSAIVLRINDAGLGDLAEFTRQWMFETLKDLKMGNYSHRFERGLASGELVLHNLIIKEFAPPLIRYRPHSNSVLYITTVGGDAEIHAGWNINSNVLAVLGIPLHGTARGKITGFRSSVAVHVVQSVDLVVHQCIARFGDFELHLSGSLAAEILHWFRNVIGRIMQARVEQAYCKIIGDQLLPWLKLQLLKFPKTFQLHFGQGVRLSQSLHSIRTSEKSVDLQMKNQFFSNGFLTETVSTFPEPKTGVMMADIKHDPHVVEIFLDEGSLQEMVKTTHYTGELVTNITSPFLTTDCELLCLGKIVPELRQAVGKTALYAEVFTNEPPIIKLMDNRAKIFLNVTFGLYEQHPLLLYDSPAVIKPRIRQQAEEPVIQIEILSDAEVYAEMEDRQLDVELNLHNSKASLLSSKIGGVSQKTVDLILSMSVPFLENAAELLLGNGARMEQFLDVPCQNETMHFEQGFVHFLADMNIRNLL